MYLLFLIYFRYKKCAIFLDNARIHLPRYHYSKRFNQSVRMFQGVLFMVFIVCCYALMATCCIGSKKKSKYVIAKSKKENKNKSVIKSTITTTQENEGEETNNSDTTVPILEAGTFVEC